MTDADDLFAPLRRPNENDTMAPAAADRLEAALRVAHAERRPAVVPRWRRPAALVPVALVLVIALSFAVLVRDETPSAALVLTDAENVTVVLPDGSVVTDPADGFELPDGAVVEIGEGGMATIDDITVDSPATLSVRDGRLVTDLVATTTTPERPDHLGPTSTTTLAPADVATTTTAPPTTAPPTTEAPVETTTSRAVDEPTTTTTERERDRDERSDRDGDRGERDGERGDRADEPPADAPTVSVSLQLTRTDDGVRVAWNVDGLQSGWRVVIARSRGDGEPVRIVDSGAASGELIDDVDGRRLRYRLAVVDEAGGEVASGPIQSLR